MFYKNTTSDEPLPPMNIPGCGLKCSLSKFHGILEEVIPTEDFESECKIPDLSDPGEGTNNNGMIKWVHSLT